MLRTTLLLGCDFKACKLWRVWESEGRRRALALGSLWSKKRGNDTRPFLLLFLRVLKNDGAPPNLPWLRWGSRAATTLHPRRWSELAGRNGRCGWRLGGCAVWDWPPDALGCVLHRNKWTVVDVSSSLDFWSLWMALVVFILRGRVWSSLEISWAAIVIVWYVLFKDGLGCSLDGLNWLDCRGELPRKHMEGHFGMFWRHEEELLPCFFGKCQSSGRW